MLRTMLVEDERMFAEMLAYALHSFKAIQLYSIASSLAQARRVAAAELPDLLILDLSLPDGNGLDFARELVNRDTDVDIIILSAAAKAFDCPDDLKPHIKAVVPKSSAYEKLRKTIEELTGPARHPIDVVASLTQREREIIHLIGQGLTSREIADRLGRSLQTINTHRKNISVKLRLRGARLVAMASEYHNASRTGMQSVEQNETALKVGEQR